MDMAWDESSQRDAPLLKPAANDPKKQLTGPKFERRQGKWTRAECEYAMLLIEHFTSGRLPGCSGGESLRTTLSECLMCTPMRITKKLSATHAIGKCCFKKKGELNAKERVDLEAARAAFVASVERKDQSVSSTNGAPRKRVRTDDDELLELGDWLDDPLQEESWASPHDATHAPEPVPPSVSARLTRSGKTAVRVVVADRPGLIGEISAAFKRKGLSIVGCVAETLPGDVAHDEFEVVYSETKQPITDQSELRAVEADLERSLLSSAADEDGASETSSVKTKSSDNGKRVSATTLQVTVPDRPGLLKQITTSLASLSLSIVGAKIETVDNDSSAKTALDTFDVVDAESGDPVLDPARLRAIEERLAHDLETATFDPPSNEASPIPYGSAPAPGPYDFPGYDGAVTAGPPADDAHAPNDDAWIFPRKFLF